MRLGGVRKQSSPLFSRIRRTAPCLALILALIPLLLPALPGRAWAQQASSEQPLIFLHYWTGPLSGGVGEMTAAFNDARPEVRVRATGFEHESFKVGITVMLAGGNPPDMFSYWAGARVQALVDKNYLAPLDDVWRSDGLDKRFSSAVGRACTYDGRKYVVPVTQHVVGVFYNTKVFAKAGVAPPKDWESFLKTCRALKNAGVTPLALGSRERWPAQFWFDYLLLRTAGPDYRQKLMEGDAAYTDAEVSHAFSLWRELIEAGFFNEGPNAFDWSEAATMVRTGAAAMTLMGTWIIGLYDGELQWRQGEDYDFFPFPVIDETVDDAALGPIDALVAPREGRVEAAKQVLAYFTGVAPQKAMSRGSGALSPNKTIPPDFYTPMQRRILQVSREAPRWAFNYDLAVPPPVAEKGLNALAQFIHSPEEVDAILENLQSEVAPLIGIRGD